MAMTTAVGASWPRQRRRCSSYRARTRDACARHPAVTTHTTNSSSSSSPLTHAQATAFLSLSDRLFAHEAAAAALPPLLAHGDDDDRSSIDKDDKQQQHGTTMQTTEAMMQLYVDPLAAHDDDDTAMSPASRALACMRNGDSDGDVDAGVRALLTLSSSSDDSDTHAQATRRACDTATALLLRGLDVKAVLTSGTLSQLRLRRTPLVQCDLSLTRWRDVCADGCSFAMSVWYGATLHDVTFTRCNFDACVLKQVHCRGRVRFVQCTLRRAVIGVMASPSSSSSSSSSRQQHHARDAAVVFEQCDMDLASFEGCAGLRRGDCFRECRNIATTSGFPQCA